MLTLFARDLSVVAVCCLIIGGCGAKPTQGAPETQVSASAAAPVTSGSDASAAGGPAWGCEQYVTGGVDYQMQSPGYLFIGGQPMCTQKDKLQDFCNSLRTREGFMRAEEANSNAESAGAIAETLPEEARAAFMQQHPKHVFEQSIEKCGLKVDQVRSQLVVEAEAAIKAGGKTDSSGDTNFLLNEAPANAEAMWTRECAGHLLEKTQGEGIDWLFNGNQNYAGFCKAASNYDTHTPRFKTPAAP